MLDHIRATGNVKTFDAKELLERFLATAKEQVQEAERYNQRILFLIFAHGHRRNSAVDIGGKFFPKLVYVSCTVKLLFTAMLTRDSQCLSSPKKPKLLFLDKFKMILLKKVETSLVITSCCSGGWLIRPDARSLLSARPRFNITGMTAAGITEVSQSWAKSESMSRASGSMFITMLLNGLIATTKTTPGSEWFGELPRAEDGEEIDHNNSPTYAKLCYEVYGAFKRMDPTFHSHHQVSFAAQDDLWNSE